MISPREHAEALGWIQYWQERAEEAEAENEDLIERIASMRDEEEAKRRALSARLADLIAALQ